MADYISNRNVAIALGKAFFWDMQIGSDGTQACATCHFRAGADSRIKNQLSPGGANNNAGTIDLGGPNSVLTAAQFPLLLFSDRTDRNSTILRQTDDTVASMGVHGRQFLGVTRGDDKDTGASITDPIYTVAGINVRRVEPRNTPTMINAALFNKNFWDGRANNIFNGVSEFGAGDQDARVLMAVGNELIPVKVRLDFSSLASQAVGPIISNFEMSYFDRSRRDIGKRVLHSQPLAKQLVHPQDSILGALAKHRGGDFHELNNANMDFEIGKLGLTETEIDDLASFLRTFTDERIRNQQAPFDHPELFVPNGSVGDNHNVMSTNGIEADNEILHIPAVGRSGGPLAPAFLPY